MDYVVMDLHQKFSELCVVDDVGEVVERATVSTTEKSLRRWFKRDPMRIAVETSSVSPWVDLLLRELGHEVYVVNPRRVRLIAEATLKTEKVDAETLARLVRLDPKFLSPITHRSVESRQQRAVLRVRAVLVETRSKMISVVRGLVKQFGKRMPACTADTFVERFRDVSSELDAVVIAAVTPLVDEIEGLGARIATADAEVKALASQKEVVERLDAIPGVGELVAVAFVLCVDDPTRFKDSRDVAGFLGLRPAMRSSADVKHYGRITKQGDRYMRALLIQAAHAAMRSKKDTDIKRFGERLVTRVGRAKAHVAVARKLAVLMHRLWVTGERYRPTSPPPEPTQNAA
jgi:transposase